MADLFIKSVKLNREKVPSFDKYPFNILLVRNLTEVKFNKSVTFLVGENGVGKSTIIEALAKCMGMAAEGGSHYIKYETRDTTSVLNEYLTITKSIKLPAWKFFLRAESFYTMANAYERMGKSMHQCSHGEGFVRLIDDFSGRGLYILDEPESALSPKNQMYLLCKLNELSKQGAQFIISTHSPILLSYRDGEILDLDNGFAKVPYTETAIYQTYKRFLDCPDKMQEILFDIKE